MRNLLVLLLAAALAVTAAGCATQPATGADPAAKDGRPVIVLLDLSGSTEAVAPVYKSYVQTVIDSLKGGEQLLVLPVSGASLTATTAVNLRFPAYHRFTTNAFTHGRAMKRLKAEALAKVDALLAQPRDPKAAQHTAIIDGLMQARDLAGTQPATLFLISDMLEDSDLGQFQSLTAGAIPAVLAKAEQAGRLPRFSAGTQVHVAGLNAASQLDASLVLTVRQFWTEFFTRAGATLVEYGPEFHSL